MELNQDFNVVWRSLASRTKTPGVSNTALSGRIPSNGKEALDIRMPKRPLAMDGSRTEPPASKC